MILIKREKLDKLYDGWIQGVPYSKLIRMHNLNITHPTLSKLMEYFSTYQCIATCEKPEANTAEGIILASLFPDWLSQYDTDVVKQPSDWRYEGKMPLGKWVQNTWAD